MEDRDYRLKRLNELSELSNHKKTQQRTELLDLFATYVYMINPDYKYNETYVNGKLKSIDLGK